MLVTKSTYSLPCKPIRIDVTRYARNGEKKDLILLHGFLGSGKQFDHLLAGLSTIANPVTINFSPLDSSYIQPTPSRKPVFTAEILVRSLQKLISLGFISDKPLMYGYSMGGRLALAFATEAPSIPGGIILESSTAGLKTVEEQLERRQLDAKRAVAIRKNYLSFLKHWERQPIFKSPLSLTAVPLLKKLHAIQTRQDPDEMACWLEDFGTGHMPSLWSKLHRISCPVLLISGENDQKFCDIARKMSHSLVESAKQSHSLLMNTPSIHHVVIPGAGHRAHIDHPEIVLKEMASFGLSMVERDA